MIEALRDHCKGNTSMWMLHCLIISAICFCPHVSIYYVPIFLSHCMIHFSQQLYEVGGIIVSILQVRKQKHTEISKLCKVTYFALDKVGNLNQSFLFQSLSLNPWSLHSFLVLELHFFSFRNSIHKFNRMVSRMRL